MWFRWNPELHVVSILVLDNGRVSSPFDRRDTIGHGLTFNKIKNSLYMKINYHTFSFFFFIARNIKLSNCENDFNDILRKKKLHS